ncbi:unnamed protein product [Rotaria sordida]|uniref:Uncharacterized protein n=1 Tax=Rotaria sordida TaxID=392033 RepID=A0A819BCT4_9BILA|nr:unnamed protein product [Rotaria sordida]
MTSIPSFETMTTSTTTPIFIITNTFTTEETTTTVTTLLTTETATPITPFTTTTAATTEPFTTETPTSITQPTTTSISTTTATFIITELSTPTENTTIVTAASTTETATAITTFSELETSTPLLTSQATETPTSITQPTTTSISTTTTTFIITELSTTTETSNITSTLIITNSSMTTEATTTVSASTAVTTFTTMPVSITTTTPTIITVAVTTMSTTSAIPVTCNGSVEIQLPNGTCVPKTNAQIETVNILRNRTMNATAIIYALSLYLSSIANSNISSNPNYILSASEIDEYIDSLDNVTLILNTNTSFIMAQQADQIANGTVIGGSFTHGIGGQILGVSTLNNTLNSNLTTAAFLSNESLVNVTSLNILIIDMPTTYENIDNSRDRHLASSVIVMAVKRNSSVSNPMNILLYFQVLNEYVPTVTSRYLCTYYDINGSKWNESGCTTPQYNTSFNRYECSCNHLSTFALIWSPYFVSCNSSIEVQLPNGTCISKSDGQILTVNILRSNTANSTVIANALSLYISSITNSNTTLNSTYTLTANEIDTYLSNISNVNLTINTNDSFLMAQQPNQGGNVIVLGASFNRGIGGQVVNTSNVDNVTNSFSSAAAIISNQSLIGVTSLNMLIINKPTTYEKLDNSTNKMLASSVIVVAVRRNSSLSTPITISLYFQILPEYQPNGSAEYLCSFYDTTNSKWNESGCTIPQYNVRFNRYECNCNHLTSFALIWLPRILLTSNLDAQDIGSLVCLSISIICFLIIIIHASIIRIHSPIMGFQAYDLFPLISSASTTILFIFYIAMGMTVYTRTSSINENRCFLSSSVLMFFTYFFLIFMFCAKTSVGYFNYLRFVHLFPQPSLRKLFIMLGVSFLISITWVAFAAGFNSNSSFQITQLYPYKLCWFTRRVIYYFLTIPVCLFLLINIFIFIRVSQRIINHVRHATSPHQTYERMKRCVLILLSSCATQGIGWLFGPFLTIASPEAGYVLAWFFIICNGLEGLWSILLYIIIRSKHMDEQRRSIAVKEFSKTKTTKLDKSKTSSIKNNQDGNDIETRETEIKHRNIQKEETSLFDDSYDLKDVNRPIGDDDDDDIRL